MFLYDKKENSLDIYSVDTNQKDIEEYRKKKLSSKRFWKAIAYNYSSYDLLPLEKLPEDEIPIFFSGDGKYHLFEKYIKSNKKLPSREESLLQCYYSGEFCDKGVIKVNDYDRNKTRYFLLSNTTYSDWDIHNGTRTLTEIIELPEDLYLLQMLEQEKFSLLIDKDISEQLALLTVSQIDEISYDSLKKMDACGITQNVFEQTLAKAENDAHVLKLIKKQKLD